MSSREVTIKSAIYPTCRTAVEVATVPGDGGTIILRIGTGAASLQTYATRAELRRLGEMLLRHANENEMLQVAA